MSIGMPNGKAAPEGAAFSLILMSGVNRMTPEFSDYAHSVV